MILSLLESSKKKKNTPLAINYIYFNQNTIHVIVRSRHERTTNSTAKEISSPEASKANLTFVISLLLVMTNTNFASVSTDHHQSGGAVKG